MLLSKIADELQKNGLLEEYGDYYGTVDIGHITFDSRQVQNGTLFTN